LSDDVSDDSGRDEYQAAGACVFLEDVFESQIFAEELGLMSGAVRAIIEGDKEHGFTNEFFLKFREDRDHRL